MTFGHVMMFPQFLWILSLIFFQVFSTNPKIPLQRILQFSVGDETYGSFRSKTNGNLDIFKGVNTSVTLTRKVIFIKYEEIIEITKSHTIGWFPLYFERKDVLGMIVILPLVEEGKFEKNKMFENFEQMIISQRIDKPFFFVTGTKDVISLYNQLSASTGGLFSIFRNYKYGVISQPFQRDSQPMTNSFQMFNFFGELNAPKRTSKTPTIAIVSSYDSLSIAPSITGGISTSSSVGLLGVFELCRIFKKLYSHKTTEGDVNIIFVLTGGSIFSHEGSKYFVQKALTKDGSGNYHSTAASQLASSNVKFILYLDSFVNDNLFLHVSKKFDDPEVIKILTQFKKVAKQMEIDVKISLSQPKKLNEKKGLGEAYEWEHEIFQRRGLPSATLSGTFSKKKNDDVYDDENNLPSIIKSSISDRKLNTTLFMRNVRLIGESFINYIYRNNPAVSSMEILSDDMFDKDFLRTWIKSLNEHSRSTPYLTSESDIIEAISKTMSKYVKTKIQSFTSKTDILFYDMPFTELEVYNMKPLAFELLLFLIVALYILGLTVYLQGYNNTYNMIIGLFGKDKVKVT